VLGSEGSGVLSAVWGRLRGVRGEGSGHVSLPTWGHAGGVVRMQVAFVRASPVVL
jgi:hypothetical protein